MVSAGVKCLVMEVSSQAIYMNRIHGIEFDTCVFTNLYLDHVGGVEHPTFEHYRDSKRRLFTEYGAKTIIYNADDDHAEYMMTGTSAQLVACSTQDKPSDIRATNVKVPGADGRLCVSFDIEFGTDRAHTSVSMPGLFSVYNALLTAAICKSVGLSVFRTVKLLPTVSIDGRFEVVDALPDATFVIDYAHNGASLSAALTALREYNPSRLICLFGSVGGRTFGRRHELGEVAASLADLCIITSDNPDSESPAKIIDEIAECFDKDGSCPFVKITDRRDAIRYAVKNAKAGDIILLAGKGHEDYQLINGKKLPFSERAIILEAAEELLEV
jgi:UDP-N-acetylmuramoyl-L-alanyl-D-glutamate--2,6-diaminopimelate ligase